MPTAAETEEGNFKHHNVKQRSESAITLTQNECEFKTHRFFSPMPPTVDAKTESLVTQKGSPGQNLN